MRAVVRLVGLAVVGVALYYAGAANSRLLSHPRPDAAAAVVGTVAMSLTLLVWLVSGSGRDDARVPPRPPRLGLVRALWLGVSAFAFIGIVMLFGVLAPRPTDWTPYHNDAIALNECAARLVLQGQNPYASLDVFACYRQLGIGPDRTTPLRRGLFRNVEIYPNDPLLDAAWAAREGAPERNVEFEWRPSYPSLSFLILVPWVLLRLDPNLLSLLFLVVAMAAVITRTHPTLRGLMLTALLASVSVIAFTIGGTSDLFYATPLVVAWLWRERRWTGLAMGVACAMKQQAWFAAPFYFLAVLQERGWREALRHAALAAGVFASVNLPYVLADPSAWAAGVSTPLADPMFPRGIGLVFLSTSGGLPLLPAWVYASLEALAFGGGLLLAWRARRGSPEVGIVLAFVPLFFAWRSLFSYFFLLPLFAAAAVARMPLGALAPEEAARAGAVALVVEGPRPVRAPA